jgi:glycosyltransferase involved in cell wall biosynthesis
MDNTVIVSIVIPCYNNHDTIVETLESISSQDFKDFEIIIVNDGSTDTSKQIIEEYCTKSKSTITLINQENSGPSFARNKGASCAKGKYLLFIDADDKMASNYISECLQVFKNKPDALIVYSEIELFEAATGKWELNNFKLPDFLITNCIPICGLIETEKFKDIGGFDTEISFTEDWELWIRFIQKFGLGVYKIPKPLFFYRKRFNQNSLTDTKGQHVYGEKCRLYIYNKHYDFYKKHNLSLDNLFNFRHNYFKIYKKYYNTWYKKLFYSIKR